MNTAHKAYHYKATARVTYEKLPSGTRWYYVEAPPDMPIDGVPPSEFEHGVIATHAELDIMARQRAQLEPHPKDAL